MDLLTTENIIAFLITSGLGGILIGLLIKLIDKKGYLYEFNTFVKLIEVFAERHDLKVIDTLNELLQLAKEVENDTPDIEKVIEKEIDDIKKLQS